MPYQFTKTFFTFSTIACALLRIWLKMTSIDPETGFYLENSFLPQAFDILLLFSAAMLFVLPLLQRKAIAKQFVLPTGFMTRILLLLCGVCAFWCAASCLLGMAGIGVEVFALPEQMSMPLVAIIYAARLFFLVLLPAAAGFLWIRLGLSRAPSLSEMAACPWLALTPVFWQGALTLTCFMDFTAMRSVSDQRLFLLSMAFAVPTLLALARIATGIIPARGQRQFALFGFLCALFSLIGSVGMIAGLLAGRLVTIALFLPYHCFYLAFGLLLALLLVSMREEAFPASLASAEEQPQ